MEIRLSREDMQEDELILVGPKDKLKQKKQEVRESIKYNKQICLKFCPYTCCQFCTFGCIGFVVTLANLFYEFPPKKIDVQHFENNSTQELCQLWQLYKKKV